MSDFSLEVEYGGLLEQLDIFLTEAENELKHYGVKGMRWGIRKDLTTLGPDKIVRTTASGATVTLSKQPLSGLQKVIGTLSPGARKLYANSASFGITDAAGKKIGEAQVTKHSKDELNLVWLGIRKDERGKGYATAIMKATKEFGRREGFKKLTLEVPGNSPDALHIYKKVGFKIDKDQTDKATDGDDDVWGGLTSMSMEIKHSSDELVHFGVKGMKWGQTKTPAQVREQRIAKLQKTIRKVDSNKAYQGYGLRGHYAGKINRKAAKRNPDWDPKAKKTPEEAAAFAKKTARKARNGVLLRGIPQLGLIALGGNLAVNKLASSPQAVQGGRVAVGIMAVQGAKIMYNDISAINQSVKLEKAQAEIRKLDPKRRGGYV